MQIKVRFPSTLPVSVTASSFPTGTVRPAKPTLTWTSPSSDATPEFALDLTAPAVGDIVQLELATNASFTAGYDPYSVTLDSTAVSTLAVNFGITNKANGTWYARMRHKRAGVNSSWSNTVTVTVAAAPAFTALLNFRDTAGYVTDGTGQTYVLETDVYPTTRNGLTFGWTSPVSGSTGADRNAAADPRLAGINYDSNQFTSPSLFRLDLPSAGTYAVDGALGDDFGQSNLTYVVKDNATDKINLGPFSLAGGHYSDFHGTDFASRAAWIAGHSPVSVAFASTALIFSMQGQSAVIAHLSVTKVN